MIRRLVLAILLLALQPSSIPAASPETSRRRATPAGAQVDDIGGWIEGRNIGMRLTNLGAFAYDMQFFTLPGVEFPKQSGSWVVFAGGLWLGSGLTGGRVTVSEYVSEYAPGAAPGGIPDPVSLPELRMFKLFRHYASDAERDAALSDYQANAVPRGAPNVQVQEDGSLSIRGDQMTWSVFNDLDHSRHVSDAGNSSPLQFEVRHTTWAYDRPGPLGQVVLMNYVLLARGPGTLHNSYVGIWVDPDVGGFDDDLVGCDVSRQLAFAYNATNLDLVYGSSPPAVGFDLLQGPLDVPSGARRPLTSLVAYTNGGEPIWPDEPFRYLQGLQKSGAPILDPSNNPTRFMFSGDPVAGTGWLDASPTDRRILLGSGPLELMPDVPVDFTLAILAARGPDRLASVALLQNYSDQVQAAFDAGDPALLDVPTPTVPPRLVFSGVRPNPSRHGAALSVSLASESDADVEVMDLAGRRVASHRYLALPAGPQMLPMPESPFDLVPGIYLVRFRAGGGWVVRRWVVLE